MSTKIPDIIRKYVMLKFGNESRHQFKIEQFRT